MLKRWVQRLPLKVDTPQVTVGVARRWVVSAGGVWAVLGLYVAQVHLPSNTITLPGQHEAATTVNRLAPQGWGFFTKSPRDDELQPYAWRDGTWTNVLMAPHGAPRNAFGLNRRSRSQGIEMALLLAEAQKVTWNKCGRDLDTCLHRAGPPATVSNRVPEPTLCGRTALVEQKPVPFAWRNLIHATHTPDRLTVLDVAC
ncbi:SdpA family antimicrobial peptide system protein [Streptomyces sp. NPDC050619]|uniref:SdpA family antimicrobial peptide system protein n=1 Tax=Streptomyces sp. NPDC050619 TaxID=3157214 RepID=UPI0034144E39